MSSTSRRVLLGSRPVIDNANVILNFTNSNNCNTLYNDISGSGNLTLNGCGNVETLGKLTYTGTTCITGGGIMEISNGIGAGVTEGGVYIGNGYVVFATTDINDADLNIRIN